MGVMLGAVISFGGLALFLVVGLLLSLLGVF